MNKYRTVGEIATTDNGEVVMLVPVLEDGPVCQRCMAHSSRRPDDKVSKLCNATHCSHVTERLPHGVYWMPLDDGTRELVATWRLEN